MYPAASRFKAVASDEDEVLDEAAPGYGQMLISDVTLKAPVI